jgi:hypothetical protein
MTRTTKILWGILVALVALGALTSAKAAEFHVSAGKVTPVGKGAITGVASIGVRGKYDLTLSYFAPGSVYGPTIPVPGYFQASISRAWVYDVHFLGARPTFLMGVSFKGADRCAYDGEVDCNRRVPLPANFHFGVGLEWKAIRIELFHDSNDAMDSGPEAKNLGSNWLNLTYRVGQ